MNAKKPNALVKVPEVDPLLEKPIPHAYALIPHPTNEQLFYAVHLENVAAERLDHLELSARPSQAAFGLQRIELAMQIRHHRKGWRK